MRFTATILQGAKTATGIPVPDEILAALGAGKRPPVTVTIRGYTWRTTPGVMGGVTLIPLSAEHRAKAGLAGGDTVEVDLELDTAPRELSVPTDLSDALAQEPEARRFFDSLSYSVRQWHVLSVEGAKTPETRQRRVEKSVAMLREGRAR